MDVIRTILAPTDLHQRSDAGLRYAAALAVESGADLHVVHVATTLTVSQKGLERASRAGQDAEGRARALLAEQVARTIDGVEPQTAVLFGDLVFSTIGYVEGHGVDLVVITLTNRSRVGKLLMGSHAQTLMLASPVPVLGVPSTYLGKG